jgi:EAL domain-containing protein (putative c-di-GMP-specific phosphodiesterase class I)
LVTPDEFIPLAEEIGLIGMIGTWVFETGCAQVKAWHEAGYDFLRLSLNVSPYQLHERPQTDSLLARGRALPRLVDNILKETGLPPQSLELEITERATMLDVDYSLAILEVVNKLGVRVAIDDFGMGSSLDLLRHFPINTLKIDQSFVREMKGGRSDVAFITAIIAMAHSLNLNVVAEGVETEAQLILLKSQQCDEVQGNLCSPPLSAEALTELLRSGRLLLTEDEGA